MAASVASSRIRAGDIDLGIVVGAEIMRNVTPLVANEYLGACSYYSEEAKGQRFFYPQIFGRFTEEALKRYEINEDRLNDAFMQITLKNRGNAKKNKNAQTRNEDYPRQVLDTLNRKYRNAFGGRTRFSDCSQISDGASILFLASKPYAEQHLKRSGRPKESIARISGEGFRVAALRFDDKVHQSQTSEYILPWSKKTIDDAFSKAGVTINDIDAIEMHDCFTIGEYLAISNFGITGPGKEYEAIENEITAINGKTPINPSGGLIGAGHPVGASGARMMLDIFKQVTGSAEEYQVENAKRGATFNVGGSCTTSMSFVIENASL